VARSIATVDEQQRRDHHQEPPMTITPTHLSNEQRKVLRPVAIAYRRAYRAGASQGESHDAGLREYRRVCPDAPTDQLTASRDVNRMVAAAINADTQWFWHGPDV
jgi:hypothetical protein